MNTSKAPTLASVSVGRCHLSIAGPHILRASASTDTRQIDTSRDTAVQSSAAPTS